MMNLLTRGFFKPLLISVFALLLLTVTSNNAQAGYFDSKLKWHTIKTDHFKINFHAGAEIVAKKIAGICEATHAELSPKYNWKPFGRTEIVITDTTDISNAHAVTLPYNYILLFINAPTGDSTLNNFDDWLTDLIRHEYTHILHIDKYGGIAKPFRWVLGKVVAPNGLTPGWVREGIAVVEESVNGRGRNNSSFSDMMLRTDILNDQFLHLDQISGLTKTWPAGNSAYIYGGAFWQYIKDTYGEAKLQEFIERYGNSIWLFSLNNKARKVYDNKNFFKLYAEWKKTLVEKYQKQKSEIEVRGLSDLQDLKHVDEGILGTATISPDGSFMVYSKNDGKGPAELRRANIDGTHDELIKKGYSASQISFFPDGKKLVFSYIKINRNRQVVNDLYELDLATKKITGLTKKARATHASVSPDGKKIVFVASLNASTQLSLLDIASKEVSPLSYAPMYTQFSNPVFAPDGKSIAVSADIKGHRDILLMDLDGKHYKNLTNDVAIDNNPSFGKQGNTLYYSSDKSGVSNIYRYHIGSGKTEQLTNVLTGVFEPIEASGKLIVKNYYGRGYDLKSLNVADAPAVKTDKNMAKVSSDVFVSDTTSDKYSLTDLQSELKVKDYNAFPKVLIPRYILPGFTLLDGSAIISAYLANTDPLLWHSWHAGTTYRTDAAKVGFDLMYTYGRFAPLFYTGYQDYAVSYGDLYRIGSKFYETRRRIFAGVTYPMVRQSMGAYYFYENRSTGSTIPAGSTVLPTLGNLSGVGLNYAFTRTKHFNKKISPEGGPRIKANFEMTNGIFGSDNGTEQVIFSGDAREYIPMPYNKDHVLALRVAGGIAWGDRFLQGTFRLGSSLGESPLTGSYSRLFQLRGLPDITFAGERALLLSAEYRLPLFNAERGLGTGPIHMNAAHMAFFADWGSVWNGNPKWNSFLLGVGAELRGDFVLGYGLPITGRLGYGIIVDGREFIRGLNDPLLGTSLNYGSLILELGTSF